MSGHSRLAKRKSRAKDCEAAEALLNLHKRPRIAGAKIRETDTTESEVSVETDAVARNESQANGDESHHSGDKSGLEKK